jgi:hypothetical protein
MKGAHKIEGSLNLEHEGRACAILHALQHIQQIYIHTYLQRTVGYQQIEANRYQEISSAVVNALRYWFTVVSLRLAQSSQFF